jgi:hypothetical protein
MSTKTYIKHRHTASQRQQHRCCCLPIWESSLDRLIAERRLSKKQAALLKSTGREVLLTQDGAQT